MGSSRRTLTYKWLSESRVCDKYKQIEYKIYKFLMIPLFIMITMLTLFPSRHPPCKKTTHTFEIEPPRQAHNGTGQRNIGQPSADSRGGGESVQQAAVGAGRRDRWIAWAWASSGVATGGRPHGAAAGCSAVCGRKHGWVCRRSFVCLGLLGRNCMGYNKAHIRVKKRNENDLGKHNTGFLKATPPEATEHRSSPKRPRPHIKIKYTDA